MQHRLNPSACAHRRTSACALVAACAALLFATLLLLLAAPARAASLAPAEVPTTVPCYSTMTLTATTKAWLVRQGRPARVGQHRLPTPAGQTVRWLCVRPAAARRVTDPDTQLRGIGTSRTIDGVQFPASLRGAVTLPTPVSRSGWQLLSAPAARPELHANGTRYASSSYDVITTVGVSEVKEGIVVHRSLGRSLWRWRLLRGTGLAPRLMRDGSVTYGNRVRIAPPIIKDAAGNTVRRARWQLSGDILTLVVDDRGLALPYIIDPTADYPQRLYMRSAAAPTLSGAEQLDFNVPPGAGVGSLASTARADSLGFVRMMSNVGNTAGPGGMTSNAFGPGAGGSIGWVVEGRGGMTLPAGSWTVSTGLQKNGGPNPRVAIRARAWKVNTSGGAFTATPVALTDWSNVGATVLLTGTAQQATTSFNVATPTVLGPDDHVYVELYIQIVNAGDGTSSISLALDDPLTYVDFGGAPTNQRPMPTGLRVITPTALASGWTTSRTPRFDATLQDPEWYHHNEYEFCSIPVAAGNTDCLAAGGTLGGTGLSRIGQLQNGTFGEIEAWSPAAGLPDGTWHVRVRTQEDSGMTGRSAWTTTTSAAQNTACSTVPQACNVISVDATDPGAPAAIFDVSITGSNDAEWSTDGTTLRASWSAAGDGSGSGIGTYDACVSTSSSTCSAAAGTTTQTGIAAGSRVATITASPALPTGTQLYTCVRSRDVAGNVGAWACSDGYVIDTTPPANPASTEIQDLTTTFSGDRDSATSGTTLSASWGVASDATPGSGVRDYDVCFSSAPAGCSPIAAGASTSGNTTRTASVTVAAIASGTWVYTCVRSWDNAGNSAGTYTCSDGWLIDTVLPTSPGTASIFDLSTTFSDDRAFTANPTALSASWLVGSDAHSGPRDYDACFSLVATGCGSLVPGTVIQTANVMRTMTATAAPALADGTLVYTCVRLNDNAGLVGAWSCSNGFRIDTANPGADINTAPGPYSATLTLTGDTWDGAGSGVTSYQVAWERTSAPTGTGTLTCPASPATPSWSCAWDTTATGDGTYTLTVTATDAVGNTSSSAFGPFVVDNVAPDLSFLDFQEASPYTWGNTATKTLWYNPDIAPTPSVAFTPRFTSDDNGGSGVDYVTFPSLTPGPFGGGGNDPSADPGDIYARTYSYATGAADPGTASVTATDRAGRTSPAVTFEVTADSADPSGGDIEPTSGGGLQSATTLGLTLTSATDVGSGLDRWRVQYQLASLVNDTCGAYPGTWSDLPAGGGGVVEGLGTPPPTVLVNMAPPGGLCLVFRLEQWDHVDNYTATPPSAERRIDLTNPGVEITVPAPPPAPVGVACCNVPVSGTASDGESGVARVEVTYDEVAGPAAGSICTASAPPALVATGSAPTTTWDWDCLWATSLLDDGDYTIRAVSYDRSGRVSSADTVVIRLDNQPPPPPAPVLDGTVADADWTTSTSTLAASWATVTDAGSGIDRYEYCFTLSATGADCGGAAMVGWTDAALATSVTRPLLVLTEGTRYYACARAYDGSGNDSDMACSDGIVVDSVAPAAPAAVRDGSGVDQAWTASGTTLRANWDAATDPAPASGTVGYERCFTTSASGVDCGAAATSPWQLVVPTNAAVTTLTLADGATYYACVRTLDTAGNRSVATCSDGLQADLQDPTAPTPVEDGTGADIDFTGSSSQLDLNWSAAVDPAPASGIDRYEYCFSTLAGGTDCASGATVPWTPSAALAASATGLSLTNAVRYYGCVVAVDRAGRRSAAACSDGQTADFLPPPAPAPVTDGPAADLDYTTSTSTLVSRWATVTDPSGIARYEYCFSTAGTGVDCAGGATVPWTSAGAATTGTAGPLTLVEGQRYYACARAFDNGGNASSLVCSDGVVVDSVAPPASAGVRDGAAADRTWTRGPNTLVANWDGVVDPAPASGLDHFERCFTTSSTGADCGAAATSPWANVGGTSATAAGVTLVDGTAYYACVRPVDAAGNVGAITCSDGQTLDLQAPTAPAPVEDGTGADIDFTGSSTTLEANWPASVDPAPSSGLDRYEYCMTLDPTAGDCLSGATVAWTSTGATSATESGLTLVNASTYYTCVRTFDNAGNSSTTACSDGQTADFLPPPAPGPVTDGAGADADYTSSTTTLAARWTAVTDPSGIARYELCLTTDTAGADCAAAALSPWASEGAATSASRGGLGLVDGTSYYACARAFDNGGNPSAVACSDGILVDAAAPPAPPAVRDGSAADATWSIAPSTLEANWSAVVEAAPASSISRYERCFTTSASGADCAGAATSPWANGTGTNASASSLALVDGTTYYACVRAIDLAANVGAVTCSDGQTLDLQAPTAPAPVEDGTGADIDVTGSATTLAANWTPGVDPAPASGVVRNEYCFTTIAGGTNCATTAMVRWTPTAAANVSVSGLTLANGTRYRACVRTIDAAGNRSAVTCSDGQVADFLPPPAPSFVNDGTASDVDFTASASALDANWAAVTDPGGILRYEYCFSADPAGADCATTAVTPWTDNLLARSASKTGLALTPLSRYYSCARAVDMGSNTGPQRCSDGQTVDDGPPSAPAAVRDGASGNATWTASLTTLAANWSAATDLSGIARYERCLTTDPTGADCAGAATSPWASTSTLSASVGGLTLAVNATYHACVRAVDGVGTTGPVRCSDGQTVDRTAPDPITAVAPTDAPAPGSSVPEGTFSLDWAAGTDSQSGVVRYDLWLDGTQVATGLTVDTWGPTNIYDGPHTWRVRAWDAVGNFSDTTFSFTATDVPDVTRPNDFRLLAPDDNAIIPTGTALVWEPATDFSGIASYRVRIDGGLVATVPGTSTSFIPSAGVGAPLCTVDFDPAANNAGCASGATYGATFGTAWTVGPHGGWSASGNSAGFDAWDGDRRINALVYTVAVPASGGDLRFEHHYDNHVKRNPDGSIHSAWDGGQVQVSVAGGPWLSTCEVNGKRKYGTSLICEEEIMEPSGGYTAILAAGTGSQLPQRQVFAGTSAGMVQSKLRLSKWSGQTIRVRFVQAQDGCYVGMPDPSWCTTGIKAAAWQVDDVTVAEPTLDTGFHTWNVEAVDPAGNRTMSLQTWGFTLR